LRTQHAPIRPNFEHTLLWDSDQVPPNTYKKVVLWRQYCANLDPTQFISLPEYIEEHSLRLRNKYLAFINQVGESDHDGESVQKLLQIRPSFSYWWMTLFASTRWHPSSHSTEAIKLLALEELLMTSAWSGLDVVTDSDLILEISQQLCAGYDKTCSAVIPKLSTSKQSTLRLFRTHVFPALLVFIRQIFRLMQVTPLNKLDSKSDLMIFDHLIRFDEEAALAGKFDSQYWRMLAPHFELMDTRVTWLHQFVKSTSMPTPKDADALLRKLSKASNEPHCLFETRPTITTLTKSIRDFVLLVRSTKKLRTISETFVVEGSKANLWPLFKDEWFDSMCGRTAIRHCMSLSIIEETLASAPHCNTGLFMMENQPWEMALIHAWRSAGHGRLIGVVNAPIRFWDLRYFYNDFSRHRPAPNQVAVNSPISRNLLEEAGVPPTEIVDVEALMYQYLNNPLQAGQKSGADVLILGDFFTQISESVLNIVLPLIKTKFAHRTIYFKAHPANRDSWTYLEADGIVVTDLPLSKLFATCGTVVSPSSSTGAVEAYCANKHVISIPDPTTLNFSALKTIKDVQFASNSEELALALENPVNSLSVDNTTFLHFDESLTKWKKLLWPSYPSDSANIV
jgi:surface carbohydrate biosynthesis protein (TIGR04326 family)